MISTFLTILALCFASQTHSYEPIQAVCSVPVADLLVLPMADYQLNKNTRQAYEQLPLSWVHSKKICPRDHQLLFNEVVTIINENEEEYCIELSQSFYETPLEHFAHYRYWTLKSNMVKLTDLDLNTLISIPEPISVHKNNISQANYNIITLKFPYQDSTTEKTYSAGTRFVMRGKKDETTVDIPVVAYGSNITKLPKSHCVCGGDETDYEHYTSEAEKIHNFVELLQQWATMPQHHIPVVWGGCSFTHVYSNDITFSQMPRTIETGETFQHWASSEQTQSPLGGFDVSGLILRAAQICDIPYYYRNTLTAMRNMQKLGKNETLSEGDLIWIPGGLAVVTSLEKNSVVTLLGYWSGYGRVFQTTLNKLFNGVDTFDQLIDMYHRQESLQLLSLDGTATNVDEFKLLKISSVF